MNREQLVKKIRKAFSNVPFPGNDFIVNESYGEEPELIKKAFKNQDNWETLSQELIDLDGSLSFFSFKGFQFYLPAFMIADIYGKLGVTDPIVQLCWSVISDEKISKVFGGGTIGSITQENFREFTKEQSIAIILYLQWRRIEDNDYDNSIKISLDQYWLK